MLDNSPANIVYTGKAGRPKNSGALGIISDNKKDYNKQYYKKKRLVFSVNLDLDKDKELIEILNTYKDGNRQGAIKELCLVGYKYLTELGCKTSADFNSGLAGLKDSVFKDLTELKQS